MGRGREASLLVRRLGSEGLTPSETAVAGALRTA